MTHKQKTGLKLLIAAFVFGMATGYLGALWQGCAQKSLRAKYEMSGAGRTREGNERGNTRKIVAGNLSLVRVLDGRPVRG